MLYAFIILSIILTLVFFQFYAAKNYLDENNPSFSGNFAAESHDLSDNLLVLSYNISYGRNVEQALKEIKDFESKNIFDIFLLQEMDEDGTEVFARELGLNYVYFPAAVEPKYRKNFGNAVLSRWPIIETRKLILPHISLSDRMKRVATRATIHIREIEVLAYSIHTEPVFILPKYKQDQCTAVLHDMGSETKYVIVGGDFNSFTQSDVARLEKPYQEAGFIRASRGNGATFIRFGMSMAPDQIFTKGFTVEAAGILAEATASDHLPVWVHLVRK